MVTKLGWERTAVSTKTRKLNLNGVAYQKKAIVAEQMEALKSAMYHTMGMLGACGKTYKSPSQERSFNDAYSMRQNDCKENAHHYIPFYFNG